METQKYDIAIIGAGPAGYVAAIKAAQMGASVALIEKAAVGGVCLNAGCIPTKSLLASAKAFLHINRAQELGLQVSGTSFDIEKIHQRKTLIVNTLRHGLEGLIRANKINLIRASAKFLKPGLLELGNGTQIEAPKIIIATGSRPRDLPHIPIDHETVFDSTSILNLKRLPKSIAIIGGGYIGTEFATYFAALGVKVHIIEMQELLITPSCRILAQALKIQLQKSGINVLLKKKVLGITKGSETALKLDDGSALMAEIVLLAVGREPRSEELNLESVGVEKKSHGFITVNSRMETSSPNIYAAGDVAGKSMLAHTAYHEGGIAAQNALGEELEMDYTAVPAIIFACPECAMVGLSLDQALTEKKEAFAAAFPMKASGYAATIGENEGFAQIIAEKGTNKILGAQVLGDGAATLIAEMTLAIKRNLTLDDIADTIHAHPSPSEAWAEAASIGLKAPIHFPPKP